MEILILHPGGLGDILLSLPAIALLRKGYPSARLTIAGNIDHLAAVGRGYADHIISLSTLPLHYLHAPGKVPEAEARFWRSFDHIVSWTGSGDPEFVGKLTQIRPSACVASWRPGPQETRHVSQLFIDSLGIPAQPDTGVPQAEIQLDPDDCNRGAEWLAGHGWKDRGRLVALHPGAGSKLKRWPLRGFIDLARWLALRERIQLLIVEGPAETGLAEQMILALPDAKAISVQNAPLNLLAALLVQCKAFVGNDSGIAHLAAGLGVPSVVLFGPTLPQHWVPLGDHVLALRDPRGCEACGSGQGEHTCLGNISVGDVLTALISHLEI